MSLLDEVRAFEQQSPAHARRADEEVLRIVGEQPGITVPGISERLRVNRPDV